MQTKKTTGSSISEIQKISLEYLQECFVYEGSTGFLFWKQRPLKHFDAPNIHQCFNTKWAGKRAGKLDKAGYYTVRITLEDRSVLFKVHHVVLALHGQRVSEGFEVDHRNGSRGDNRVENLRICSPKENSRNRVMGRNNTWGHIGIRCKNNRWEARITVDGVQHSLGSFGTKEEAIKAREEAARKFYGEFYRGVSEYQLTPEDEKWIKAIASL